MLDKTFSHYRIIEELGRGGMGIVYAAEDTKLGRRVALKVLASDVASDQERVQRFIREAQAASAINHPNIATIYEIDEVDGTTFIAMELVEGETLRARMSAASRRSTRSSISPDRSLAPWARPTSLASCTVTSSPRTSSCVPTV